MTRHLTKIALEDRGPDATVILTYRESYIERVHVQAVGSAYRGPTVPTTAWRSVEERRSFKTWDEALAFADRVRPTVGESPEPPAF